MKVAHRVGGSIVALGLLDEFIVDIKARRCRALLKVISDTAFGEVLTRAARAEQAAAEANLARVRIEEKFKPRRLNKDAVDVLVENLKQYKDLRIDVFVFDNHLTEVDKPSAPERSCARPRSAPRARRCV